MNPIRKALIFWRLDPRGLGLEIGPSFDPAAPKRAGYNVKILDHLSADALRAKYAGHGVDLSRIEEVDYVWRGQPFAELVGDTRFDWIIASHVIEHVPCVVSFLRNCESILKPDGALSLVVPDKRRCFDKLREKSSLAAIIDAYFQGRSSTSPGAAAEYYLSVVRKSHTFSPLRFVHDLTDARRAMAELRENGAHIDLHSWVFTPSSFRMIVDDLHELELIHLRESWFFPSVRGQFFVTLSQQGEGHRKNRIALAKACRRES